MATLIEALHSHQQVWTRRDEHADGRITARIGQTAMDVVLIGDHWYEEHAGPRAPRFTPLRPMGMEHGAAAEIVTQLKQRHETLTALVEMVRPRITRPAPRPPETPGPRPPLPRRPTSGSHRK